MQNNPETTGTGKYGDGQNSFGRFFSPRSIICQSSIRNFLPSESLCSFSRATYVDTTERRAVKRRAIEQGKLQNSRSEYRLRGQLRMEATHG